MKKLTVMLLTIILATSAMIGCQNTEPKTENTQKDKVQNTTTPKETDKTPAKEKESTSVVVNRTPVEINPGEEYNLTTLPGTALVQGPMNFATGSIEDVFDGTMTTYVDYKVEGGEDYYVGIELESPAVLTDVQMWAPDYEGDGIPNRPHVLYGMIVEGSNDGENWDFILQLGDNYEEYEQYAWDMEDGIAYYFDEAPFDGESDFDDDALTPAAYRYYRIYNDTKGVAVWGDIALWGYFEENAETAAE